MWCKILSSDLALFCDILQTGEKLHSSKFFVGFALDLYIYGKCVFKVWVRQHRCAGFFGSFLFASAIGYFFMHANQNKGP